MAEYRSFSPTAEVLGQSLLSIMDGMENNRVRALQLLAEHRLSPLEADRWYPQQPVLDVLRAVFERIGPSTVRAIARRVPDWAHFAPAPSMVEALRGIQRTYEALHRNGEVGHYRVEAAGPGEARVVCHTPYPCDFDQGLLEALAERNRPLHSLRVRVVHAPGDCRKRGQDACTYVVSW